MINSALNDDWYSIIIPNKEKFPTATVMAATVVEAVNNTGEILLNDDINFTSSSGVTLTLIINGVISIVALVLFFTCCQPLTALFSLKKKRKLFQNMVNENQTILLSNKGNNNNLIMSDDDKELLSDIVTWTNWKTYITYVLSRIWHFTKALAWPRFRKWDEQENCRIYGRDMATLLRYEQLMTYAIAICSIIACTVLFPVHLTGHFPTIQYLTNGDREDVDDDEDESSEISVTHNSHIVYTSIFMRVNDPGVLYVHIVLMVIFFLVFALLTIISFLKHPLVSKLNFASSDEQKTIKTILPQDLIVKTRDTNTIRPLRNRLGMMGEYESDTTTVSFDPEDPLLRTMHNRIYLVSPYCVTVMNLPPDMDRSTFHSIIQEAAASIPDNKHVSSKLAKTVVVPDVRHRQDMHFKRLELVQELAMVSATNLESGNPSSITFWCKRDAQSKKFHWKIRRDRETYLKEQLKRLDEDIRLWDYSFASAVRRIESAGKDSRSSSDGTPDSDSTNSTHPHYDSTLSLSGSSSNTINNNDANDGEKSFEIPKCGGFGFVLFTTPEAAEKFARHYSRGVFFEKVAIVDPEKPIVLDGNVLEHSSTHEYAFLDKPRSRFYPYLPIAKAYKNRLVVTKTEYETQDVDWIALSEYNSLHIVTPFVRKIFYYLILALLFILAALPLLVVSGIQAIIQIDLIDIPTRWLSRITGKTGDLLFNYLPTLVVLIVTEILPLFVISLALMSKRSTFSTTQRKVVKRIYVFLVLSSVVFPSVILISADGIVRYFTQRKDLTTAYTKLFLVSSGSFFLGLLLQKALLKNSLHLFRLGSFFNYFWATRFSQQFWLKTPLARFHRCLTETQKLSHAERDSLRVEKEYAFMNWMVVVTMIYGLYSPYAWLCTLLFFLYKYYADRYICTYAYEHRKNGTLHGAVFGLKSDFIGHHQLATSQGCLMFANMFICAIFYTIFFATKIPVNRKLIPHTILCAVLSCICFGMIFILKAYMWRVRSKIISQYNYRGEEIINKQQSAEITDGSKTKELPREAFGRWYEPAWCYHFLSSSFSVDAVTASQS